MPSKLPAQDDQGGEVQLENGAAAKKASEGKSSKPLRLPKSRGTGFEEYFADPPMTPDEAAEEKNEIYASDIPFETRIQSCIQRFRARRRLQTDRSLYFNEYLFLGGIDTNPNVFGGQHHSDLRHLTPAERRDITATDTVHSESTTSERFYRAGDDNWSVDFTGVLAGFFSTSLISLTGGIRKDMETAANVIDNFLRYVRQHDVCPEYEKDVNRALDLCADARREWVLLEKLRTSFPGRFHQAATQLFSPSSSQDWDSPSIAQPTQLDNEAVFYSACALLGETEALTAAKRGNTAVVREYDCTLEVVSVQLPSTKLAERFRSLVIGQVQHHPNPIGKAFFKTAAIEEGWLDPTMESPHAAAIAWLYFEQSILDNLKPGMKLAMTISELSVGVRFVKAWKNLVPSYYTFLPQVLMKHYKVPKPNERPAASVHDPDAEEKQHANEAEA
ncbi:hypothetical protein XA68_17277 [Ophiocordyceps unilateralis]|uniref:Uncharacterized protein n=1 Tax=Ophiocordyceps unilateralis TaxID=268505 RepID=A0A2A9PP84_OPHUN|nr:hypothetical protein XA68_17277 [Ophiocordyceps unilateralis]